VFNGDGKENGWNDGTAKPEEIPVGCAHTYHHASPLRVGLIVAQVLPRVKVIEQKRARPGLAPATPEAVIY
jgi:hypothetical protein